MKITFTQLKTATNGTVYYKCEEWRIEKCRGRLIINAGGVRKPTGAHNHAAYPGKEEAMLWTHEIKQKAERNVPVKNIIGSQAQLSQEAFIYIPSSEAIRSKCYYAKNKLLDQLPVVKDLKFDIPEQFKWTTNVDKEEMVVLDTGKDDPLRIVAFSTKKLLSYLFKGLEVQSDGTFASVPNNSFYQIYSIHGYIAQDCLVPLVFFLLPNKKEETYKRALLLLKQVLPNEIWSPSSVIIDFELGAFNAFKTMFNDANVQYCYFHLTQNLQKAVKKNPYHELLKNDVNARNLVLMLKALAFVPVNQVVETFDLISELAWGDLEPIRIYFENTYVCTWKIRRLPRRQPEHYRADPRFPPQTWNMFDRTREGLPRTKNAVEGWHRGLRDALGHDHPTM